VAFNKEENRKGNILSKLSRNLLFLCMMKSF
jgi:hypothetical protein